MLNVPASRVCARVRETRVKVAPATKTGISNACVCVCARARARARPPCTYTRMEHARRCVPEHLNLRRDSKVSYDDCVRVQPGILYS